MSVLVGLSYMVDVVNWIEIQMCELDVNVLLEFIVFVYDGVGNLIFDGQYFYQYDGFNCLVEICLVV